MPTDDGLRSGWREVAANWAAQKDRIHELHLFGSRAKGDFCETSDVDIGYVLTGTDPGEVLSYSICEAGDWEKELSALLNAPVELHMADPYTDAVVWPAIQEHGQFIFRKRGYSCVE